MRLPCGPGKGRAWAMRLKLKYLHCLSLQIGMARVHRAFVHFERLLQRMMSKSQSRPRQCSKSDPITSTDFSLLFAPALKLVAGI